jgi:hypothetical protein
MNKELKKITETSINDIEDSYQQGFLSIEDIREIIKNLEIKTFKLKKFVLKLRGIKNESII